MIAIIYSTFGAILAIRYAARFAKSGWPLSAGEAAFIMFGWPLFLLLRCLFHIENAA